MKQAIQLTYISFLLLATTNLQAQRSDTFIIMGGGYDPYSSAVTMEQNMRLMQETLSKHRVPAEGVELLFGGGNDQAVYDVAVRNFGLSRDEELFAQLFDAKKGYATMLRHHQLVDVDGGLGVNEFNQSFARHNGNGSLKYLRFYFGGHGVVGIDDEQRTDYSRNQLLVWGGSADGRGFASMLDQFRPEVATQIVMTQCFSGGFAHINYKGGDPRGELTQHNRCGFFSQIASEPAAGCSDDITQREEYTPYFLAAYLGKKENGEAVEADFNRNGRIGADEAHALAIIQERSIDLPVTTSSELLRDQELAISPKQREKPQSFYFERMNAIELAIMDGLSKVIGDDIGKRPKPLTAVDEKLEGLRSEYLKLKRKYDQVAADYGLLLTALRTDLQGRYPMFDNSFGAFYGPNRVVGVDWVKEALVYFSRHAKYGDFDAAQKSLAAAEAALLVQRHKVVDWQRLQYLLETKLLEDLLAASGRAPAIKRYQQLKECEAAPFFPY